MAGGRGSGDRTLRVERVYERSRLEEETMASAYESLVPTRRLMLGSGCQPAPRGAEDPNGGLSGRCEERAWRGVG
jgi:hypothetical protein